MPEGQQFANAVAQRGATIYLRTPSTSPASPPMTGPLTCDAAAQNATVVTLRSDTAIGAIVPGDVLLLGTQKLVVSNTISAAPDLVNGGDAFVGVAFTPPLSAAVTANTALTVRWSADKPLKAMVDAYPVTLVDGELILQSDLRVTMAAYRNPVPELAQQLVIDGVPRSIKNISPVRIRNDIIKYQLQAR